MKSKPNTSKMLALLISFEYKLWLGIPFILCEEINNTFDWFIQAEIKENNFNLYYHTADFVSRPKPESDGYHLNDSNFLFVSSVYPFLWIYSCRTDGPAFIICNPVTSTFDRPRSEYCSVFDSIIVLPVSPAPCWGVKELQLWTRE